VAHWPAQTAGTALQDKTLLLEQICRHRIHVSRRFSFRNNDLPYKWCTRQPLTSGCLIHQFQFLIVITAFIFNRTDVIQRAVTSVRIIKDFDTFENGQFGLLFQIIRGHLCLSRMNNQPQHTTARRRFDEEIVHISPFLATCLVLGQLV
jgi:hypothetical protein